MLLSYFVKGIYLGAKLGKNCEGDSTELWVATRDFAKAESRFLKSYRIYGYDEHEEVSRNKSLLASTRHNFVRLYNKQPESAKHTLNKLEKELMNIYVRYY